MDWDTAYKLLTERHLYSPVAARGLLYTAEVAGEAADGGLLITRTGPGCYWFSRQQAPALAA